MAKPTIAFFGATGGSTISCLAPALEAGYRCTALARTPSKLHDALLQRGLADSTIAANLSITPGTATDLAAVKQALILDSRPVDLIVSGIGGKLIFKSPLHPTLDNPTICQDAVGTILAAVRALEIADDAKRPQLIALSTTGISDVKRDLPIAMIPMYHWMLGVPHDDKKVMESLILEDAGRKQGTEKALGGYVIVRPSLLTGGEALGVEKIRVGVEKDPAVGYTISREDVGRWVFEVLVKGGKESGYVGEVVTLTY
ncbi:NAD(P)-dependent oxidoreductase [Aspergillus lucknowensis]|uniref:NAD(P)-binding domain-containing protein n=1 Tax=Aspergillus lucknowensis TaxID=176173 RepID=A0ABR4LXA9_9EURO